MGNSAAEAGRLFIVDEFLAGTADLKAPADESVMNELPCRLLLEADILMSE